MKEKIEHLVASVEKNGINLYKRMNIKCDAIIANQSSKIKEDITYATINNNTITIINTRQKGVGKNRNQALLFAKAERCIISDDDMKYKDDYLSIINKAFDELHKADVIIFNLETIGSDCKRRKNTKIIRIRKHNFMNYGAARIVFKRESILNKNIWFSTKFGGGAEYSSGEDSIFIKDCLDNGLKIYSYPETIATVDQTKSTWFNGYTKKFYNDKGALLKELFPRIYALLIPYLALRLKSNTNLINRIIYMTKGARGRNR